MRSSEVISRSTRSKTTGMHLAGVLSQPAVHRVSASQPVDCHFSASQPEIFDFPASWPASRYASQPGCQPAGLPDPSASQPACHFAFLPSYPRDTSHFPNHHKFYETRLQTIALAYFNKTLRRKVLPSSISDYHITPLQVLPSSTRTAAVMPGCHL